MSKERAELITQFAEAVRAHEMRGSRPPEEHDDLERDYRSARSDLANYIRDLEEDNGRLKARIMELDTTLQQEARLSIDVSEDVNKLLGDGPVDPHTWRDGHKLVDLGQGRPYALVEHKVRLIDPDDVRAELDGTCQSVDDLAEDWEVPETVMLDLAAQADVEQCATCNWWCDTSEVELQDGEPTCVDCRED